MIKILVIEDDASVLDNLEDILMLENFQVFTAKDGREGVDVALRQLPDLIVCDVMMPKMEGYEVGKYLRADPATKTIPFIFLTAKAERLDYREGMESGADDYVTKPFRPQELINAIEVRLARHASLMQPYHDETQRSTNLSKQLKDSTELANIKENL